MNFSNEYTIPKDFIISNNDYILSRINCYQEFFSPALLRYTLLDKKFIEFLIDDCNSIFELSKQNTIYAKNYLHQIREEHKKGGLIDNDYDVESQIEYLTESEQDFVDEIKNTEKILAKTRSDIMNAIKVV